MKKRFFNDDLSKKKNLLNDLSVLKQFAVAPGGHKLLTTLFILVGKTSADAEAAMQKGCRAIKDLCRKLKGTIDPAAPTDPTDPLPPRPAAPLAPASDLDDIFGLSALDAPATPAPATPAAKTKSRVATEEFDKFLQAETNVAHTKDTLGYWTTDGKDKYPMLFIVVCSVFGAFGASSESERQFSTAGKDLVGNRSLLKPCIVRILSLIALNKQSLVQATATREACSKVPKLTQKERKKVLRAIEAVSEPKDEVTAEYCGSGDVEDDVEEDDIDMESEWSEVEEAESDAEDEDEDEA